MLLPPSVVAYSFICTVCFVLFLFFWLTVTRHVLPLMPHIILIGVILAAYPYPSNTAEDPISAAQSISAPQRMSEGSVSWKADIRGIQNSMGAT